MPAVNAPHSSLLPNSSARSGEVAQLRELADLLERGEDTLFASRFAALLQARDQGLFVSVARLTRELHDALKRRCLYHWIEHPGLEREVQIVRSRAPEVSEELARQVVGVVQRLRETGLQKPPGVAETLDWARARRHLGTTTLDLESAARTLGALVKYREDGQRVQHALDQMLRP